MLCHTVTMGVAGAQLPQGCKPMGLGDAPQLCGTTLTTAVILDYVSVAITTTAAVGMAAVAAVAATTARGASSGGGRGYCSCAETAHRNGAKRRVDSAQLQQHCLGRKAEGAMAEHSSTSSTLSEPLEPRLNRNKNNNLLSTHSCCGYDGSTCCILQMPFLATPHMAKTCL